MSKSEGLASVGVGLATLMLIPGFGLILLIVGVVFLAVLLGLFAVVYLTLQAYHVMTAVIFLVSALFMFYVAFRSKIIDDRTLKHYPWIPLLLPGSFILGYLSEMLGNISFTVAPLAAATPAQGTVNGAVLIVILLGILYVIQEYI